MRWNQGWDDDHYVGDDVRLDEEDLMVLKEVTRESEWGLSEITSLDVAREVVGSWQDMQISQLLERISTSEFANDLLRYLNTRLQDERRREFLGALLSLPTNAWSRSPDEQNYEGDWTEAIYEDENGCEHYAFYTNVFWELMRDPEDSTLLMDNTDWRSILITKHHPLCDRLKVDEYWKQRIRWFLTQPNYRRAFDELKKAILGLPGLPALSPKERMQAMRNGTIEYVEPRYLQSKWPDLALGHLVNELFDALVQAGQIQPITSGDRSFYASREDSLSNDLRIMRRYANIYTVRGSTYANLGENEAKLYKLMRHFRQDRNERRLEKRQASVRV